MTLAFHASDCLAFCPRTSSYEGFWDICRFTDESGLGVRSHWQRRRCSCSCRVEHWSISVCTRTSRRIAQPVALLSRSSSPLHCYQWRLPHSTTLESRSSGLCYASTAHRGCHNMVYDVELLYFLPGNTLEKMIQCFRNYVLNNCSPLTHLEAPPCFSTSMSVQSVTAIDPSATKDEVWGCVNNAEIGIFAVILT